MSRTAFIKLGFFFVLGLVVMGAKCPSVPSTEEVPVVVIANKHIDFHFEARGIINYHDDTQTIDVEELRQDLDDAGISVENINSILVESVTYGTVAYNEPATDRAIVNGNMTAMRLDTAASQTIFSNASSDVYPLLGLLIPAPIETGGITFINTMLADLLAALKDGSGVTSFSLQGSVDGTSTPTERDTNFDWRVRITYQISATYYADVPDI